MKKGSSWGQGKDASDELLRLSELLRDLPSDDVQQHEGHQHQAE